MEYAAIMETVTFMLNRNGDTLLYNDGKFGKDSKVFCPDGTGWINGQVQITHTSSPGASDDKIYSSSGIRPFLYSIDNGITYIDSTTNLSAGIYYISVIGAPGFVSILKLYFEPAYWSLPTYHKWCNGRRQGGRLH